VQMTTLIRDIEVDAVRGEVTAIDVESVEFDSRQARPGALFCCVPGGHTDGHDHAAQAVDNGVVALLCDHFLDLGVTQVRVAPGSVRPAMAAVASAFHGHPSRDLAMIGVTGTNGKTTVTQMVRAILDRSGMATGVIGTLDGARTTPESPVLQGLLAGFRDDGRAAVAMEVSSHALTQHRVDSIVFDVAAFTNLSRDHLDHHRTMERYFEAKARLFEPSRAKVAVINVDDPYGRRLADELRAQHVLRVRHADASGVELGAGTSRFTWQGRSIELGLSGLFNVDNALMAAGVATALGLSEDQVADGLRTVSPVQGRMELVSDGRPFAVFVDYAHTPAGLDAALSSARSIAHGGRVICVFGCGGDRDQGKRPEMGATAARRSDVAIITSDNPRSEDPMAIIQQVLRGSTGHAARHVEPDRARAIRMAVEEAEAGDVVVIAGKGHESTQTIGDTSIPFDDRVEARRALDARFSAEATGDVR
jgi:UDP-N-acetylmuramoyl-L-alanyl-D-glutamate--2,6-diaminopimelate ligase